MLQYKKKIMQAMAIVTIAFSFAITSAQNSAQIPAPPQGQAMALVGGTIHPMSGPAIEGATIVFDKGKITAIGADAAIPPDALRIEVSGKHVYPSLIEMASTLGLVEISAVSATRDMSELGNINPNVRAEIAINPSSEHFPVTRANGVGLAVTLPSGGLIAGKGALLQLDGWTWEDMTVKAPVCMVLNFPRMTTFRSRFFRVSEQDQKKRRKEQMDALSTAFREARAYKTAKEAAGKQGVPFHAYDARWEAMIPVLDGELPVWVNASEIKQILAAIDWASREGIKMVLGGGADAYMVTDLLKSKDIPVIVLSTLRLPSRRDEPFDTPFTLPLKLFEAGVKFCISGAGRMAGNERHLAHHAAKAASYGLPVEEALKSITLYPAEILGVADRLGSLEAGKDATLIVTDGNPLELTTNVEKLFIDGRDVDLNNKHKSLYHKYREKYLQRGYVKPTKTDE
jgi:imidazolonepropionase-like amidohydrolase